MNLPPDKESRMNKSFEQLIEYVINDEQDKARELFHDIVVEKSRQIYEEMMDDDTVEEAKDEDEDKEQVDEADDEDIDEGMVDMGNDMGSERAAVGEGDAADQMIDDIEAEEQGMSEEEDDFADETGFDDAEGDEDHHSDMGGNEELEDRVVDLEDKLDELMAEFEALMGDSMDDDDMGDDMGGDEEEIDIDSEETMMPMEEAVSLKAAPKPVTSEEGSVNKKSTVAANSGAAGMAAKPVHMTGTEAKGRPDPTTKDLISDFQNKAGSNMKDQRSAPKPVTSQASGVNTKSPLAKA
jgi:hypothetical protein